jgi:leader peptidase (prepilin peptidase)/N-methyltransferase
MYKNLGLNFQERSQNAHLRVRHSTSFLPYENCGYIDFKTFSKGGRLDEFNFLSPDLYYAHLIIVFMFGLLFGSFLNVCIYRIPAGISIVMPGSHCFSCGTPIRWYDNIPLFSYIILRGRCRWCGADFSIRYFFVELLTGILFAFTFYRFQYAIATPVYIVFVCLLIIATFTDIDHWIIPDEVSLGGAVFGLAVSVLAGFFPRGFHLSGAWPFEGVQWFAPLLNAASGAALGAFLIYMVGIIGALIFRKEAMGLGDVKLFLLIGAFLGVTGCLYVLMIGSIIGSFIGGGLILAGKLTKGESSPPPVDGDKKIQPVEGEYKLELSPEEREKAIIDKIVAQSSQEISVFDHSKPPTVHHLPFGPYIAIGAFVMLFFGEQIQRFLIHWMLFG